MGGGRRRAARTHATLRSSPAKCPTAAQPRPHRAHRLQRLHGRLDGAGMHRLRVYAWLHLLLGASDCAPRLSGLSIHGLWLAAAGIRGGRRRLLRLLCCGGGLSQLGHGLLALAAAAVVAAAIGGLGGGRGGGSAHGRGSGTNRRVAVATTAIAATAIAAAAVAAAAVAPAAVAARVRVAAAAILLIAAAARAAIDVREQAGADAIAIAVPVGVALGMACGQRRSKGGKSVTSAPASVVPTLSGWEPWDQSQWPQPPHPSPLPWPWPLGCTLPFMLPLPVGLLPEASPRSGWPRWGELLLRAASSPLLPSPPPLPTTG